MAQPRHQVNKKTFEELTFSEQAKSISAQIIILKRAIRAHIRRAIQEEKNSSKVLTKCRGQVERMISDL